MFIHLRCHSAYSLSVGALHVKDLVKRTAQLEMPAVAVTDSNNLFGALEFSVGAKAAGVQPIIGAELSLYDEAGKWPNSKLVLLVQNEVGYQNLLYLVSQAYLDGQSIGLDYSFLTPALCMGLIALSGADEGALNALIADKQHAQLNRLLDWYEERFQGRFYVELQRHGLLLQEEIEEDLIALAYQYNLPLVATNNAHFSDKDFHEAHDILLCIEQSTTISDANRHRLTCEHYFKTAQEMEALFADIPEALQNTIQIAKRCAYAPETIEPLLPRFETGDGLGEAELLRRKAHKGLECRFTQGILEKSNQNEQSLEAKDYKERLDFELNVIIQMGFSGYFLIVADFIDWAKQRDIPVGPGRGSGAGSLVAYVLGITDLDPIPLGLLFERFLNPERVSMPDFDIDFCPDRRDEVIGYVKDKYGADRVAQIITFGKLQARAALRDVGRVLQMPYGQVDRICKLVPNNPANPVTLEQAIASEPDLAAQRDEDPAVEQLLKIAMKIEGLYRHASTHAAGVVIGDRPLHTLVPLYRDPRSEMPATQFNMKWVESAGLVKFDFLGLKTLSVLRETVKLVEKRSGHSLDLSTLALNDTKTYTMLSRAEALGVFQLESSGMRSVLKELRPDCFGDIIAVVSLYRPGPMDNIPAYCKRKHGEEKADFMHPVLEPILKETHGIMIYQEQVMQAAQLLSGYTLGSADLLRRAMGKKIESEMVKQRALFRDGAKQHSAVEAHLADQIFDQIQKFAGYGFNKSHAAAYALVSYHTAYLKCHYPHEFFAATMTYEMNNTDRLAQFKAEADRLGIKILPPDVNRSSACFDVEMQADEKCIRYSLAALKNVGEAAIDAMVECREQRPDKRFTSLADFFGSIDSRVANKRLLESLCNAGAFDSLHPNRAELFANLELGIKVTQAQSNARNSDTFSLFGNTDAGSSVPDLRLTKVKEHDLAEKLRFEFEAVGFYLSSHPLDAYKGRLSQLGALSLEELAKHPAPARVKIAGLITGRQMRTSAKGARFAFVQLSQSEGSFEVTLFSELLSSVRDLLEVGNAVLLEADLRREGNQEVKLLAQSMRLLDEATAGAANHVMVYIETPDTLSVLKQALGSLDQGAGRLSITLDLADGRCAVFALPGRYSLDNKAQSTLAGTGLALEEIAP